MDVAAIPRKSPSRRPPPAAAEQPEESARSLRDRYIGARFAGFAAGSEDLRDSARVIEGARLFFLERKTDRALELLDLAIEECPRGEALRLARLEIAFLMGDGALYAAHAQEFKEAHPGSSFWDEITRLGRAVAPAHELFGTRQGKRAHEHYGPWPHTPNWILASWDLTSEVLAADYHRAMARTAPAGSAALRVAA